MWGGKGVDFYRIAPQHLGAHFDYFDPTSSCFVSSSLVGYRYSDVRFLRSPEFYIRDAPIITIGIAPALRGFAGAPSRVIFPWSPYRNWSITERIPRSIIRARRKMIYLIGQSAEVLKCSAKTPRDQEANRVEKPRARMGSS